MAGYKIDQRQLMIELSASDPILKGVADQVLKEAFFDPAVAALKADFEQSEVTKEIRAGIDAPNNSRTLDGSFRDEEGDSAANLTSFIGFDEPGAVVLSPIVQRLDPRHPDGPKMIYKGRDREKLTYNYEIRAPSEEKIYDNTPFPDQWLQGDVSWAQRIESGLPGIAHFLNVKGRPSSRSGGGIQIEGTLRTGRFRPVSYLSQMFNNFLRRVAGRSDNGRGV